jgi:hypothetical protein
MANAILTPTAVTRGAQIVACDAARRLAVQTQEAEHALGDGLRK